MEQSGDHSSNIQFLSTSKGKPIIVQDGYQYRLKRINQTTKNWQCMEADKNGCKGRLTTSEKGDFIATSGKHTCIPNDAAIEVKKCLEKCRKRAREEMVSIPKIFDEELRNVKDRGLDFVTEVPLFGAVKSYLYRERIQALGATSISKKRQDVILPSKLLELPNKKSFLLIDDGAEERILCFATPAGLKLINSPTLFMDGTFKSCSIQFDQLYTIHADIGSNEDETNVVPIIYCLLPNRKTYTYTRLFNLLRDRAPHWNPKSIKIDFECSAISAIKSTFPLCSIKGCNFHFNQCIWRKVQNLGLTQLYREDLEIKMHIRKLAALAHIPICDVSDGFLDVMGEAPSHPKIEEFNDYFVDQWLENSSIEVEIWNCHKERHRTTNSVEAWHSKLNRFINKKPNICELVHHLKGCAADVNFILERAELFMPQKKRRKIYIQLDSQIKKILEEYENKTITLTSCLDKLGRIQKLE